MEFVKVASGDDVEVYQAMRRIAQNPFHDAEGKETSRAPEDVLVPFLPEVVTESVIKGALKEFANRQIAAVSVSDTAGISVRVARRTCRQCGDPLEDAHRFCPSCGTSAEEE